MNKNVNPVPNSVLVQDSRGFAHLFILIILSLVIVGGTGYYAYKKGQIRTSCPPISSKRIWFFSDPTASWERYRNEKYGIEISYPPDLTLGQISERSLTIFRNLVSDEKTEDKDIRVNFYAYDNSQNQGLEDFFRNRFCSENQSNQAERAKCIERFEISKQCVEIAGIKSLKTEHLQYGNISKVVLLPYHDFVYSFSLYGSGELNTGYSKTAKSVFNKILSTITFTGPPQLEGSERIPNDLWNSLCDNKNLENFDIKVQKGDSATSIARQALDSYLTALTIFNIPNKVTFSSEERVYAEDYIRKKQDLTNLTVNTSVQVPCNLTEEATIKARLLTISKKQDLKEYSKNVTQYQILDLINEILEESTPEGELKPQIFTLP